MPDLIKSPPELDDTERCVACGLCLPHCPTYQLARSESESPRGRIALLHALARGDLPADTATGEMLSRCLLCGCCERNCPSNVPFTRLMDSGRAILSQADRPGPVKRLRDMLIDRTLERPEIIRRLASLAKPVRRLLPDRLAEQRDGLLGYLPALQPHPRWADHHPAMTSPRGEVVLFLGCVARGMDGQTIDAAIRVLTTFGFDVAIPAGQACCGALPQHLGRDARRLWRKNAASLLTGDRPIIHTSSACAATMRETQASMGRPMPVAEVCDFLDRHWPESLSLDTIPQRVAFFVPCTHRNQLPVMDSMTRFLERLPDITPMALAGDYGCCGSAGSHMLTRPARAAALRAPLIEEIRARQPDLVVTTNIGCSVHLAQGLRGLGLSIPVYHPVSLLADRLLPR